MTITGQWLGSSGKSSLQKGFQKRIWFTQFVQLCIEIFLLEFFVTQQLKKSAGWMVLQRNIINKAEKNKGP